MTRKLQLSLAIVSIALFAFACWMPAAYGSHPDIIPGWGLLIIGPIGPFDGQFGWYANPLLLVCLLSRKARPLTATISFLFAMAGFSFDGVPDDMGHHPISAFGPGFYLWQAAIACNLIRALMLSWASSPLPEPASRTVTVNDE